MSDHVYKVMELVGSSEISIDDAIRKAIARASETIRRIAWFEVIETRGHVQDGLVAHFQVTLKLGFTLEDPEVREAARAAAAELALRAGAPETLPE